MKRIREKIESILFAGLKPAGAQTESKPRSNRLRVVRDPIERLLSGGRAPTDPLYLTNRSRGQKIRSWVTVGVPLLILIGGIGIVLSNLIGRPAADTKEPTAAEIAAKMLPDIPKDMQIGGNKDLELVEVRVDKVAGATKLVGIVRNKGNRELDAEIIFDLTDVNGSQVGSVSSFIEKVPAAQTKPFQTPLKQPDAAFGLVREIISHPPRA